MKLFNKVLLSTISMFVVANSISYSMDDPIRDGNNNQNHRSYSANHQHKDDNLNEQDKIKVCNYINDILIDISNYSDNLLKVNKYYLDNCKIKLQNQITRIKEINMKMIDDLTKSCFLNRDNYFLTLSNIKQNDISIDNLKERMKIVEEELGIQYEPNDIENNIENNINNIENRKKVNNNYSTNVDYIRSLPIYKSIENSLLKVKPKDNFHLRWFIESGLEHFDKLKSNIDENNILIKEIKDIVTELHNNYQELYLKTNHLKECINSGENDVKKLNNETKEQTQKMKNLKKRFYKITEELKERKIAFDEEKIKDIEKKRKKYIAGLAYHDFEIEIRNKDRALNEDGTLKQTNRLDINIRTAKENVLDSWKKILNGIGIVQKYIFNSKDDVVGILIEMKSMLSKTCNFSINNDKILNEEIEKVEQLTHYNNILLLDKEVYDVNNGIIPNLNTVADYSKSINAIQDNMCDIEDKLKIKYTISRKYEKTKIENGRLIDKNKKLKKICKDVYSENRELCSMLGIEQQNNIGGSSLSSPLWSPAYSANDSNNNNNSNSNINSPININIINVKDDDNNKKENEYINRKRKSDRNDKYNK